MTSVPIRVCVDGVARTIVQRRASGGHGVRGSRHQDELLRKFRDRVDKEGSVSGRVCVFMHLRFPSTLASYTLSANRSISPTSTSRQDRHRCSRSSATRSRLRSRACPPSPSRRSCTVQQRWPSRLRLSRYKRNRRQAARMTASRPRARRRAPSRATRPPTPLCPSRRRRRPLPERGGNRRNEFFLPPTPKATATMLSLRSGGG